MHGTYEKQTEKQIAKASIGNVVADYITHKQLAVTLGVITDHQFQQSCAALNLAVEYANGSKVLISNISGSLWKEYGAWRRRKASISEPALEQEQQEIAAFFMFAEKQGVATQENRPCFYKAPSVTDELMRWIDTPDTKWAAYTLKFPRFRNREIWEYVLKEYFIEIERTCVKTAVRNKRLKNDLPVLRRFAYLGGDKNAGVVLHAHGLIEIQERGIEHLEHVMSKTWKSVVKKYKKYICQNDKELDEVEKWLSDAKVWVKEFVVTEDISTAPYIYYIGRKEGNELGKGTDKLVVSVMSI